MAESKGKIGSLFYGMTLDTKEFSKSMKTMRKKMKSFGKMMKDDFKAIAKGGALVGTAMAAGSAGMLLFAKSTLEANNAQILLANSIGSTQADIAALELGAERFGVKNQALIDRMREIGGIDAFNKAADEVKAAGDETAQLEKAMELFGRQGAKILPVLQQGSEGMRQLKNEALDLGLALTPEQVEKNNIVWTEFEDTLFAVKGLGKQIGMTFAETLGTLSSGVRGFIGTFKGDIIGGFKSFADSLNGFLLKTFNLFAEYGIPFINAFVSFAGQIGEAFGVLFDWLSPATQGAAKGFGSLFKGITEFLATFKQNVVLLVAGPIEAVLKGIFNGLAWISEKVGDLLSEMLFGLAHLGVVSEAFADGFTDAMGDQQATLRRMGKDLSKPFKDAQDEAMHEMADILVEQNQKNTKEISKFQSFIAGFQQKLVQPPAWLTGFFEGGEDVLKKATESVSDKMSGMILSGSQEEARLKNSAANKTLEYQRKTTKATETIAEGVQNLGLV
jgi:hypothetical protein